MIRHFHYLGYNVYYFFGDVYICDIKGNFLEKLDLGLDDPIQSFIGAKDYLRETRDGLNLLHRIIPNFEPEKEQAEHG